MLYGFRPRMFVFTALLDSQKHMYIELKFCINVMLL